MRFPLSLTLAPAAALQAATLAAHAAAAIVLLRSVAASGPLPASFPLRIEFVAACGWAVIGLSLLLAWRAETAKRELTVILHDDGVLSMLRAGVLQDYRVDGSAVDFGWAVWLPLTDAAASGLGRGRISRRLMLLPANLPAGQWRALRIWLRHKAVQAADADLR